MKHSTLSLSFRLATHTTKWPKQHTEAVKQSPTSGKSTFLTFKGLLKVRKVLFPDVGDCFTASVCCFGHFVVWVASLKERDNVLCFMRGERLHDVSGEEEAHVLVCLH